MRVYLTGFMAAGKSTVGRLLAERLACGFVDLDTRIEQRAGAPIPELFARRGEAAFRALESAELERVSGEAEDLVVATGGGILGRPENRRLIAASGVSVWLRPPFELLARRLAAAAGGGRPLFRSPEQAEALYRRRLADYRRCDLEVAVPVDEAPAETAERIRRLLRGERCGT